jgi:hypothetical protein
MGLRNSKKRDPHDYRRYYPTGFLFQMLAIKKHPQVKLYPSEPVTIGILFSLKGGFFRAFYRWLKRDDGNWFGNASFPVCNAC